MTGQSESDPMTTPTAGSAESVIDLSSQVGGRIMCALAKLGQVGPGDRDMADLATSADLLAVHVNTQVWVAGLAMDVSGVRIDWPTSLVEVTEHVDQHGVRRPCGWRAQRQVEHRAQMLLELTGEGPVDGPVAGVMRSHGQLVTD